MASWPCLHGEGGPALYPGEIALGGDGDKQVIVFQHTDRDHPPRALCVCEAHTSRWDMQGGIHHQWRPCEKSLLHWTQRDHPR